MATKNPRINVTFEKETAALLAQLAKKRGTSIASITKELVLDALERQEDIALSKLAESRDTKKTKRIPHKDAWE